MAIAILTTCKCGGFLRVLDRSEYSLTAICRDCQHASLMMEPPQFSACIYLCDFHLKRGDVPQGRAFDDLGSATRLYESLMHGRWPCSATELDFGIDSSDHLNALRYAVRAGITAYDLDRVTGDGPAITDLVRSVPFQPNRSIVFVTVWDGIDWIAYEE